MLIYHHIHSRNLGLTHVSLSFCYGCSLQIISSLIVFLVMDISIVLESDASLALPFVFMKALLLMIEYYLFLCCGRSFWEQVYKVILRSCEFKDLSKW